MRRHESSTPSTMYVHKDGGICFLCGCAIMAGDVVLSYDTLGRVEHKGCRSAVTDGTAEAARADRFNGYGG